jgi:hypothetical protein
VARPASASAARPSSVSVARPPSSVSAAEPSSSAPAELSWSVLAGSAVVVPAGGGGHSASASVSVSASVLRRRRRSRSRWGLGAGATHAGLPGLIPAWATPALVAAISSPLVEAGPLAPVPLFSQPPRRAFASPRMTRPSSVRCVPTTPANSSAGFRLGGAASAAGSALPPGRAESFGFVLHGRRMSPAAAGLLAARSALPAGLPALPVGSPALSGGLPVAGASGDLSGAAAAQVLVGRAVVPPCLRLGGESRRRRRPV